ncbi:MAG: hypothetical protein COA41_01930 [Sphingopyxis sp.]|nr:MAG: hypothetical protein COA41_01930 [Sphingopyxis sp.]
MLSAVKRLARRTLSARGFRIVPEDRDAAHFWTHIEALDFSTVIDVGANNGSTCNVWLQKFPSCHIHAFEALEMYQQQLRELQEKHPHRMTIWPFAASDNSGTTEFQVHEDHPSSSSLLPVTDECKTAMPFTANEKKLTVQVRRIDQLLDHSDFPTSGKVLIKLDVQGAELQVLKGCEQFFHRIDAAVVEINLMPLYKGQPTFLDIATHLESRGLIFAGVLEQFHLGDGTPVYLDAVFLRSSVN